MSPALQELVRLLAEKAAEQYLREAGAETERQGQGARPEQDEPQTGQSVQEGRSYG